MTSIRNKHLDYNQAISAYLKNDIATINLVLARGNLTNREKALIEARKLFRRSKWSESKNLLEGLSNQSETGSFLLAERSFLLSTANSYLGAFEEASNLNLKALSLYESLQDQRGIFLCRYNLSIDYHRLGFTKTSDTWLKLAAEAACKESEKLIVARQKAERDCEEGNYEKACLELDQAYQRADQMNYYDRIVLDAVAAKCYTIAGRLERAFEILQRLKTNPLNQNRAQSLFEYRLLDALRANKLLGPVPESIQSSPEHYLKWKILISLESGDLDPAYRLWDQLSYMFPRVYSGNFKIQNEFEHRSVFGRYLSRIKRRQTELKAPRANFSRSKVLRRLHETLAMSSYPLRKEDLIEKIWQVPYSPDYDGRFYKAMERLKKLIGDQKIIQNRHAYKLVE